MADLSNVDPEKILSAAGRMEGQVSTLSSAVQRFTDAINTLDKQWTSEAKATMLASYESDREALNEMLGQMTEFCELLRQSAQQYEQSESSVADRIKTLK